jgi:hypothetical protein
MAQLVDHFLQKVPNYVTSMDIPVELDKPELKNNIHLKPGVTIVTMTRKASCGEYHSTTNCLYMHLLGDILKAAMLF